MIVGSREWQVEYDKKSFVVRIVRDTFHLTIFWLLVRAKWQVLIMLTEKQVEATFHSTTFEILVCPMREDQILPTKECVVCAIFMNRTHQTLKKC